MDTNELKNISDNLYNMLILFHSKLFSPLEKTKGLCIPPSHVKTIFFLSRRESCSVSDIAKFLEISKPNMTPILDKLLSEGFIDRYPDPEDRRIIRIKLTEKARGFLKQQEENMRNTLTSKISSLPKEDLLSLAASVENMNSIISKLK